VIFESKFGRENSYSIYCNIREFPSVVWYPYQGTTPRSGYPVKGYPIGVLHLDRDICVSRLLLGIAWSYGYWLKIITPKSYNISDWLIGKRDEKLYFDHSFCTVSLSGPRTTSVFMHMQLYVNVAMSRQNHCNRCVSHSSQYTQTLSTVYDYWSKVVTSRPPGTSMSTNQCTVSI
jgi:hypothetical protein